MMAVVIRQILGKRPVTLCVIPESTDPDVANQEHYLRSIAEEKIDTFKKQFVEFQDANFYIDIID